LVLGQVDRPVCGCFSACVSRLLTAVAWGLGKGVEIPWSQVLFYTGFLFSLALCFLGIGMLISTLARSSDVATGAAFVIWLVLLLFMDLILLGVLIQEGFNSEGVIAVALVNPLQVFRTASMLLFDPQLVLLGPSAYVILDHFGEAGYIAWALVYPGVLGLLSAWLGYLLFRRGDLP
jgi:ABC-2 type transport system permease protein